MLTSPSVFSKTMTLFITHKPRDIGMEILKKNFTDIIHSPNWKKLSRKEFVEYAHKADVMYANGGDLINKEVLDSPKLKCVSVAAAGADKIDMDYATKRKIAVSNTHVTLADTCADTIMGLILACARRIAEGNNYVKSGEWAEKPKRLWGIDIHHKTMGIIGAGHIGQAIAQRARGFSMNVIFNDIKQGPGVVPLDQLLKESDVVVAACPLTEKTKKLIGRREIGLMKPTAILANIGRGAVFDTDAVCEALEQKKIWGAALDVLDKEPVPKGHRILKNENLVITPHIGSSTLVTTDNMAIEAANACVHFLKGEKIPNISNPAVYE